MSAWTKLEQAAQKLDHRAKVLSTWQLRGGISATMDALEVLMGDGSTRKLIVRRLGERTLKLYPQAATDEFRILQFVQAAGVKAQTPYLVDTSGEIFAEPYLLLEYIEGEPLYAAGQPEANRCAAQMAAQLAKLHSIAATETTLDMRFLPRQTERMAAMLQRRPAVIDESLDEERVRALLNAAWPLPPPHHETLLHGDFWPGNLLWREGALMAVIDWEDAEVGNPLSDFATTRLDLLWIFGREAMLTFTRAYQSLTRCEMDQLPYFDLFAALRSASRLHEWSAMWAELGRSDITAVSMASDRRWFVQQAFEQLIENGNTGARRVRPPA